MRRVLVLFVLVFLISGWSHAQQTTPQAGQSANCTQVLRLARAVYEQGRLHELEKLLEDCLKVKPGESGGFATVQEKVDAYRLLCLSYIYLEEPAKADQAMLGLLDTDNFFVLNQTDPAEFQALYKTFRVRPVFSFGGRIAGNLNMTHLQSNYYVWAQAKGEAKYSPGPSFSGGLFIEKELFTKTNEKSPLHWTTTRFEAFYHNRNFTIKNPLLDTYKNDNGNGATAVESEEAKTKTSWIDLNLILRYRFKPKGAWDPYIGFGPGFSILTGAKISTAKVGRNKLIDNAGRTVASDSYSGPEINKASQPSEVDVKDSFNPTMFSLSALVGVNKQAGAFYINAEVRYQYGFGNRINSKNRTIPQLTSDYGIIFDDYSTSNVQVVAGITFPYFKPKKLTKRKK